VILLRKTSPDTVTGRVQARPGSFMWLRARVDNPLRDGGRYTTVFSLDDAESRTTDIDPKLVDDKDFRFVLQRCVPMLQSITWSRLDETAVLVLRAQDTSWAEVAVAETRSGRHMVTQGDPDRMWDDVERAAATWTSLGRPARQRFGLTATVDGKHRYWLDSPEDHILDTSLSSSTKDRDGYRLHAGAFSSAGHKIGLYLAHSVRAGSSSTSTRTPLSLGRVETLATFPASRMSSMTASSR
jgi:hypothetical protein